MVGQTGDVIAFDLEDVPVRRRGKVWTDALNAFFYDYNFRLPDDFSSGAFKGCRAGELSIASIASDAMTVFRTQSHITHDGLDAYFVLLPAGDAIGLSQGGRDASVRNRQFSLVGTSAAYAYVQTETTRFNNLIIPGKTLRQVAPHADDLVASASGGGALERMFFDLADALCTQCDGLDARTRDIVGRQAVELLGLVLDGADATSSATPIRMAHYRRIRQLIDREFARPSLDTERIAATLRLSPRYLQSVTATSGTTITRMIRQRRIAEAQRLIALRGSMRISISEIAYRVGFTDLAHFSRSFKQETGYAPSHLPHRAGRYSPLLPEAGD